MDGAGCFDVSSENRGVILAMSMRALFAQKARPGPVEIVMRSLLRRVPSSSRASSHSRVHPSALLLSAARSLDHQRKEVNNRIILFI